MKQHFDGTGRRSFVAATLFGFIAVLVPFLPAPTSAQASEPGTVELFTRPGCVYCAEAKVMLQGMQERRPSLTVLERDVIADPSALQRLEALSTERGISAVGVPAFLIRDQLIVGFASAEVTGAAIERALDGRGEARAPGLEEGGACDGSTIPCEEGAAAAMPAGMTVERLGLPLFTILLGLIDGFNPCAMWVLLLLLSLLVHLRDRRRMALFAATFVLVSGLVYFAFMAAWLNFFQLIGVSPAVRWALGIIAVGIGLVHVNTWRRGDQAAFALSIPDRFKPGIMRRMREVVRARSTAVALGGLIVLALMVNVVELLCTAGLPALYTQVLAAQNVSSGAYYGYLALYNVAYMVDDGLMVAVAVVTLSQRRLQEGGGRWLKLVSGVVLISLGLLLALKPEWLNW